jgi:hypothetical protein
MRVGLSHLSTKRSSNSRRLAFYSSRTKTSSQKRSYQVAAAIRTFRQLVMSTGEQYSNALHQ